MKKLIILASVLSFNASATSNVTSVMNGSIDVGTFVSALPNQFQNQTSVGLLTGSTIVSGTSAVPVITSSITGAASSVSAGTGATYSSFIVNGLPSSAVVQGSVTTTIINQPLVNAHTVLPIHH